MPILLSINSGLASDLIQAQKFIIGTKWKAQSLGELTGSFSNSPLTRRKDPLPFNYPELGSMLFGLGPVYLSYHEAQKLGQVALPSKEKNTLSPTLPQAIHTAQPHSHSGKWNSRCTPKLMPLN